VRVYSSSPRSADAAPPDVPLHPDRIVPVGSDTVICTTWGTGLARVALTTGDVQVLLDALSGGPTMSEKQLPQKKARDG
jgi:hypothetical protein